MNKGVLDKSTDPSKQRSELSVYIMLFGVAFVGMMLAFIPTMMKNQGIFLYYGDFNSQQMMFYYHANEMVRNGNLAWDWGTDLGSNFIGSYSFYLLGSPFFWLSTLFPIDAVKYLMPWLLSLKTAVAAVAAYAYIRRFVKNQDACFIGAMLYAFSGFQLYNVFFNHFHDVTAFFPLLLLSFEQLTQDRRRGIFALCVALCAAISYFFFVCEVVFVVVYFFIRCTDKEFRMDFKIFGSLLVEAVIGVLISGIILLPAVYDVVNNPRVSSRLYGTDMVIYGENVRIPRIIQAFFMMSDMPARTNILKSDNARWASIAGYLPMFSMCGVIAYMRNKRKSWLTKMVAVCGIMMCIPVLNSAYVLFNSSYYARWYYMPILLMCLMTAKVYEDGIGGFKKGYKIATGIGAAFLMIGMLPKMIDGKVQYFQNFQYKEMYYMQLLVTAVLAIVMGLIIYYLPGCKAFNEIVSGVTAAACIITMFAGVNFGAVQDGGHDKYIKYAINGRNNIDTAKLDCINEYNHLYSDNTFFRIDTSESVDNWCMFWGLSSMRTFHSVVPPSIMDFYSTLGQTRDVASRMEPEVYGFRSLFSVRYYFKRANNSAAHSPTVANLAGFEYIDTQNDFHIYENKNWVPMGFTYDCYTEDQVVQDAPKNSRPNVLMEAVVLDKTQINKYKDILKKYQYSAADMTSDHFAEVCADKRQNCCYSFENDTHGFKAKINTESSKLVFFSVPYADGWTATVNGQPADIEKVNYGFMAVVVPAGDNEIVFSYETAGLKTGVLMTISGTALLLIYVAAFYVTNKNKKKVAVTPDGMTAEAEGTEAEDASSETEETEETAAEETPEENSTEQTPDETQEDEE
ncbi:Uncharacterized membrane protein YfhO [Ruminococcus sp. YE71]|uniref:YfhO family protein n=1 Tax=unclassified Ruminococcus TaxID=2608920 RepID=UPI0008828486|nr:MULTISPECIES: YfhO family protein [unclassified Ruminococcus]SDA14007.1 Uncharacterized membrane protein YfhO [Ruminococcus sp. YE78]SFW20308.1 Uncharacterized membrane protein YfhO [Ruminococcus sp. YE71]